MEEYIQRLLDCFPDSFINRQLEFVADITTNSYFSFKNCNNEFDIKCKVIEWLSRTVFKTAPYKSIKRNIAHQDQIRECVNKYLETNFSREDMELIYTKLGNAVHHDLTIKFIKSNYDLKLLESEVENE